jgi:hypothetical protein
MRSVKNGDSSDGMDYCEVLERYNDIVSMASSCASLMIVAPDIVGDQLGSFDFMLTYKNKLDALINKGVRLMIPLQKGPLAISAYYQRCVRLFGDDIVAGIPANAKAIGKDEVLDFCRECQPHHVHFLGSSEHQLAHQCAFISRNTVITADATKLRKHIGKGRLMTRKHHELRSTISTELLAGNKASVSPFWDETEVLGDIHNFFNNLESREKRLFCRLMNAPLHLCEKSNDSDALWEILDDAAFGYAMENVRLIIGQVCETAISPKMRTEVIFELASLNVI